LLEKNIVSDKAQMRIVLPDDDKVQEAKIVIYDNVGNVVFETAAGRDGKATWNLRNSAGRYVANGGYLVIAEVKGISGKVYAYSAKVGVRR
jgi:flagellar hook assembly protein FlgD